MLLGAGGMLHRAWQQLLQQRKLDFLSLGRPQLDLTDRQSLDHAVRPNHIIINCAAYTDVDGAESDEILATQINGTAVGHLARLCKDRASLLIHYSTDYVFNGRGSRPYRPTDPADPINAYGRSKALGERLIAESGCEHLIIRTSWLYAPWGKNFVRTIVSFVQRNRPLRIVNDQVGRPTSAERLAQSSLDLIEKQARGIYHLTDGGQCTWYDFAREIARQVNQQAKVDPCTTSDIDRAAPRPAYSVLALEESEKLFGPMTPWQDSLADVIRRIEP